ncbi:hypothetical protein HPP92_026293, partial [Vanilla planifolia]
TDIKVSVDRLVHIYSKVRISGQLVSPSTTDKPYLPAFLRGRLCGNVLNRQKPDLIILQFISLMK